MPDGEVEITVTTKKDAPKPVEPTANDFDWSEVTFEKAPEYSGNAVTPQVKLSKADSEIEFETKYFTKYDEKTDTYSDPVDEPTHAGTYYVCVVLKDGTVIGNPGKNVFEIAKCELLDDDFDISLNDKLLDGSSVKFTEGTELKVDVSPNKYLNLTEGEDYEVGYLDTETGEVSKELPTAAGTYQVVITVLNDADLTAKDGSVTSDAWSFTIEKKAEPVDPGKDDGLSGAALVAATVTGGAVVGSGVAALGYAAYGIGTELYLNLVLPAGVMIPTTREQLALLLWNDAQHPEAESTIVYADVDASAQTAARWVIENDLLKAGDKEHDDVFASSKYVSKFEVAKAWRKAQKLKKQ